MSLRRERTLDAFGLEPRLRITCYADSSPLPTSIAPNHIVDSTRMCSGYVLSNFGIIYNIGHGLKDGLIRTRCDRATAPAGTRGPFLRRKKVRPNFLENSRAKGSTSGSLPLRGVHRDGIVSPINYSSNMMLSLFGNRIN